MSIQPTISLSVSGKGLKDIVKAMEDLADAEVLVGVPEERSGRPKDGITNAQLAFIHTHGVRTRAMREEMGQTMQVGSDGNPHTPSYDQFLSNLDRGTSYSAALSMYIHEHGSPAWRIPPRPIIEPALSDPENKEELLGYMRAATEAALDGGIQHARARLKELGMAAQNVVREWFVNPRNLWAPNAESTINGWTAPWGKWTFKRGAGWTFQHAFFKGKGSDNPLIDTGQLRRSITYVLRRRSGGNG